jgi:cytochrome c biogenesis protein CcmG, thiol:disulfide interchange protein DsbE
MRWAIIGLVSVLLVAAVVVGLTQAGGEEAPPPARPLDADAELKGAPPELASLHNQANQLLGGGEKAFEARRSDLLGYPVVVNAWASWCGPCRFEFPFFQREAVRYGKRVAFMGVDVTDNREDAKQFLARYPVSFPSYEDPRGTIARSLVPTAGLPNTAFYDRNGRQTFVHQGGYPSEAALRRDIERYALRNK